MTERVMEREEAFWDVSDLALYLKLKVKTVYGMVAEIPHYRIGKLIRFKRSEIEAWMEGKHHTAPKIEGLRRYLKDRSRGKAIQVDRVVRSVIDQTKREGYKTDHGKPDHIEDHGKENRYGDL